MDADISNKKLDTSFKGDVLRLVSGTGIAQIIGILSMPILSRLYAPEAFGIVALFASLSSTFGIIACMRYELAILLPDNGSESANLLGVCLLFAFIIAFFTILIIWFGGTSILEWVNMLELESYLWLTPIAVLLQGLLTAFNYWNTRTKHFMRLSVARVFRQLTNTTGALSAGFAGHATSGAMILASLGSRVIEIIILGWQILHENSKYVIRSIKWQSMLIGIKKYRKFPLYSSWSALLNTITWQLPPLMFAAFFSPKIVGYYSMGFRVIQMPMQLVGQAISQVFLQRVAEERNNDSTAEFVETVFQRLVLMGLFPILILTLLGRNLFVFLFGADWSEAGVYAQILGVWGLVWFISSPLGNYPPIIEKQEFNLKINIGLFLTRALSIAIGGYLQSPRLSLILFSATGMIVYLFMIGKILIFAGVNWRNSISYFFAELGKTGVYMFPILLFKISFGDTNFVFICLSLFISVVYYINNLHRIKM